MTVHKIYEKFNINTRQNKEFFSQNIAVNMSILYFFSEKASDNLRARFRGAACGFCGLVLPMLLLAMFVFSTRKDFVKKMLGPDLYATIYGYLVCYHSYVVMKLRQVIANLMCASSICGLCFSGRWVERPA